MIELPPRQVFHAFDASCVRILQEPGFDRSPIGVEVRPVAIDFEENVLHHVFGFAVIAHDAMGHGVYQVSMPSHQLGKGLMLPDLKLAQKILVGNGGGVSHANVLSKSRTLCDLYGSMPPRSWVCVTRRDNGKDRFNGAIATSTLCQFALGMGLLSQPQKNILSCGF